MRENVHQKHCSALRLRTGAVVLHPPRDLRAYGCGQLGEQAQGRLGCGQLGEQAQGRAGTVLSLVLACLTGPFVTHSGLILHCAFLVLSLDECS